MDSKSYLIRMVMTSVQKQWIDAQKIDGIKRIGDNSTGNYRITIIVGDPTFITSWSTQAI